MTRPTTACVLLLGVLLAGQACQLQAAPVVAIAPAVAKGLAAAKAAKVLAFGIAGAIDWTDPGPREAFVRDTMADLKRQSGGRYNIIIFRDGRWLKDPQGIIPGGREEVKFTGKGPDAQFSILIFSGPGQFERRGDGGFPNWRFSGWYKRESDRVVTFKQSPKA